MRPSHRHLTVQLLHLGHSLWASKDGIFFGGTISFLTQIFCLSTPIRNGLIPSRYPVTREILDELRLLQLTPQRIQNDPRFLFATELVLTNRERNEVNRIKCKQFAIFHKRLLVKYPLRTDRELQQFALEQQYDMRENNESALYGYFVSGMPGMIMENICTAKGITNGT